MAEKKYDIRKLGKEYERGAEGNRFGIHFTEAA
jgi:hypothetical protein